jgi:hypothetical protein
MRFANNMFEPIWNANYVDHVQITMAEDIGIGGRAGYYDGIGAARDVIQNHLLQLMALVAMEEPTSFDAESLRFEKQKVLASVVLPSRLDITTARGQYASGWQGGEKVIGFLEEEGIRRTSRTETYAAITLNVDTRRWAGVPFYLRTGKRLGRRVTEVAVVFKRAPHLPFSATATEELTQNALVIRVQPDEGMTMRFGSKVPGTAMEIRDVNMDFAYGGSFTEASAEAYERLILDVLLGVRPSSPVTRRSSSPGRSSTRSSSTGLARGSRRRTHPAPGARSPLTRCSPATDAPGGGHDDVRAREHHVVRDRRRVRAGPHACRITGDGHGDDADHRGAGRGRRGGHAGCPARLAGAPGPRAGHHPR